MKTFIDDDGNEHVLHQEKTYEIQCPPETIEKAINLAVAAFPPGMYHPYHEAPVDGIERYLRNRGLSDLAAAYAAEKGYALYHEKKSEKKK